MRSSSFYSLGAVLIFTLACAIATADVETAAPTESQRAAPGRTRLKVSPPSPLQQAPAGVNQPAGEYAGESTCLTCHDDRAYKGTAHGLTFHERTPASNRGCESCHGPAKAHADSGDPDLIRSFREMRADETSATCTSCHNRASHALWDGSQHDQRNISCINCHSVHAPAGPSQIKASTQMALCSSCHRNVTNRQHRFSHMPVREGQMTCSSCHNVHGSTNVRLLRAGTTIDESCTSCHADKRGPYLWEHAPVTESCVTCHEPHGSNNDRMLVSKQPFLCQRCHVTSRHPPTVYEGFLLNNSQNANKIAARSCTVCHQLVHGSNAPAGKAFLR
jgi:DmsE family decaheme c-type cytochrome